MKKIFILSLLAIGLTACSTWNRAPYSGDLGTYGFTYDLDASPSPFIDTSYRPLTAFDLAAPIIITVTNQAAPEVIYQTVPEIGVTKYAGESSARVVTPIDSQQINEAAGANRQAAGAGAPGGGAAPGAAGAAPTGGNYFSAPGVALILPSGVVVTNTNNIPTNNIPTNNVPTNNIPTNNIPTNNIPTNQIPTNQVPLPTNQIPTNVFPDPRTNQLDRPGAPEGFPDQSQTAPNQAPGVNDPAGAQAPTRPGLQQGQPLNPPGFGRQGAPQNFGNPQPPAIAPGQNAQPAPGAPTGQPSPSAPSSQAAPATPPAPPAPPAASAPSAP